MTPREETMRQINMICAEHAVGLDVVMSRRQAAMPVRREIVHFLREKRHWSLSQIATFMRRHHTTILHLLRT